MTFPPSLRLVIIAMISLIPNESLQQSHSITNAKAPSRSKNPNELNQESRHCDTEKCDSLVSKCNLTNRCSCNFKEDLICAKRCIDCLEEKFGLCCGCVGLCPTLGESSSQISHVGHTSASDEDYFNVLTEEDDIHGRWSVLTPSTGLHLTHPEFGQIEIAYRISSDNKSTISHDENLEKSKCNVAFINRHLSMSKCRRTCSTMGASFFRWFHEGCCECVGAHCLKYGIEEPKCLIQDE